MTFLKNNAVALLAILLFALWTLRTGGCDPERGRPIRDTIRTETITYIPQPPVYIPMYQPGKPDVFNPVIIPPNYRPSENYDALVKQFTKLVQDHLATKTYRDSIQLKDTAGNRVGVVNLVDVVAENEIKTREPSYQLSFPLRSITNNITVTNPPRRQLFAGAGLMGQSSSILSGAVVGLGYKNLKDQIFFVEVGGVRAGDRLDAYGSIKSYWKIKLGK